MLLRTALSVFAIRESNKNPQPTVVFQQQQQQHQAYYPPAETYRHPGLLGRRRLGRRGYLAEPTPYYTATPLQAPAYQVLPVPVQMVSVQEQPYYRSPYAQSQGSYSRSAPQIDTPYSNRQQAPRREFLQQNRGAAEEYYELPAGPPPRAQPAFDSRREPPSYGVSTSQ